MSNVEVFEGRECLTCAICNKSEPPQKYMTEVD